MRVQCAAHRTMCVRASGHTIAVRYEISGSDSVMMNLNSMVDSSSRNSLNRRRYGSFTTSTYIDSHYIRSQ